MTRELFYLVDGQPAPFGWLIYHYESNELVVDYYADFVFETDAEALKDCVKFMDAHDIKAQRGGTKP